MRLRMLSGFCNKGAYDIHVVDCSSYRLTDKYI